MSPDHQEIVSEETDVLKMLLMEQSSVCQSQKVEPTYKQGCRTQNPCPLDSVLFRLELG